VESNRPRVVLTAHGSGGRATHELIDEIFLKYFGNTAQNGESDSAILHFDSTELAFTTDSYVIDPLFFPGGDIGKLAVCGTVNDLAVVGAKPLYLSCGFILEEGFPFSELESIVKSMAYEAHEAGVSIVTGDTKVVPHGKGDKVFINTSGIGQQIPGTSHIAKASNVQNGDAIIVSGPLGNHSLAVLAARKAFSFATTLQSDCASLNRLIEPCLSLAPAIHFMRDATRGGLATVLCELQKMSSCGIIIHEELIPVDDEVKGLCSLLGFDPLYLANEGVIVLLVESAKANEVLEILHQNPLGPKAKIIGTVDTSYKGNVVMQTITGGKRLINMLHGEQLPRIC
jgi:hydrogenase expression/formation protein HypE